jgi:hypothetical protein
MKKTISIIIALLMMTIPYVLTTAALAEDGSILFRDDLDGGIQTTKASDSELNLMKTYLLNQYNNTLNSNRLIDNNMGYLFALKGIQYAINKTAYGTGGNQVDCSKLVHNSLLASYEEKNLSDYYPFGSRKSSQGQYNDCVSFGLAVTINRNADKPLANLKTGDLVFWCNPSTGKVNHVGLFLKYNGENYVIEAIPNCAVVSKIWENDNYIFKAYARLNTAKTATFKTAAPFNESLGTQKVLYNCPPSPPTPPSHSGYIFINWSPSVANGMTSNKTYTANYQARANIAAKK